MSVIKKRETAGEKLNEGATRWLGNTERLMIAMVEFTDGPQDAPPPAHSHPHDQAGYLAEGEIEIHIGSDRQRLCAGDLFFVPSGVPHTVKRFTKYVRIIECFTPIREDFLKK
jgi:quercetin dioxygenase-like cupin family protein